MEEQEETEVQRDNQINFSRRGRKVKKKTDRGNVRVRKGKQIKGGKKMANVLAHIHQPTNAVQVFPDSDRYKCRYTVKSASSNKLYMISFDSARGAGYWVCSCPGACIHGQCKHLSSAGLKGRKFGKDLVTLKALGL